METATSEYYDEESLKKMWQEHLGYSEKWTISSGINTGIASVIFNFAAMLAHPLYGDLNNLGDDDKSVFFEQACRIYESISDNPLKTGEYFLKRFKEDKAETTFNAVFLAFAFFSDANRELMAGDINKAIYFYGVAKTYEANVVTMFGTTLGFLDYQKENYSEIAKKRHAKNRESTESQRTAVVELWQGGHPTEQRGWRTITEAAEFAANHLPGVKFRTAQKWISEASKKP